MLWLPVISLHLPSCRLVSLSLVSLFIPSALPLFSFPSLSCPFHFPFCFPFISPRFPVMSTSYFLPSFPCTSLHVPFAPQYFPARNFFSSDFAKKMSNDTEFFQIFGKREAGNQTSKEPGSPRRLRLVERHQITAQYVPQGGLSSLKSPTRLRNVGGFQPYRSCFCANAQNTTGKKRRAAGACPPRTSTRWWPDTWPRSSGAPSPRRGFWPVGGGWGGRGGWPVAVAFFWSWSGPPSSPPGRAPVFRPFFFCSGLIGHTPRSPVVVFCEQNPSTHFCINSAAWASVSAASTQ